MFDLDNPERRLACLDPPIADSPVTREQAMQQIRKEANREIDAATEEDRKAALELYRLYRQRMAA